jgi:hypothetical protein
MRNVQQALERKCETITNAVVLKTSQRWLAAYYELNLVVPNPAGRSQGRGGEVRPWIVGISSSEGANEEDGLSKTVIG